jgi:Helicase conserved C-terminal domain
VSDGRAQIVAYLRRQLIGPAGGQDEELGEPPTQRYLMGILFPQRAESDVAFEDDVIDDNGGEVGEETGDDPVALANQYMPSSVGLSFVAPRNAEVRVTVHAARYEQTDASGRSWRRLDVTGEAGLTETLPDAPPGVMAKRAILGGAAEITALRRPFGEDSLVTVALVNASETESDGAIDQSACLAQVSMECSLDGGRFKPYPTADRVPLDAEDEEMTFLYRSLPTYAVGHGCAAAWKEGEGGPATVRTEFMPEQIVPDVVFDISGFDDVRQLAQLAAIDRDPRVIGRLRDFTDAYSLWVEETIASTEVQPRFSAAKDRLAERLRRAVSRMQDGVELLASDDQVRTAFGLANEAMLMQMRHTRPDLGGSPRRLDEVSPVPPIEYLELNWPHWRPFQLAFLLLTLRSVADETSPDHEVVDLIWFPTGGGKTEAYLGVVAVQVLLRRLRLLDEGAGTTVITRYTLRLLTTQQFQRAAALTCALELLRRGRADSLGSIPISIGIWVGGGTSPNTYAKATELLDLMKNGESTALSFQLETCPWCGCEIVPSRATDDDRYWGIVAENADFRMHCPNAGCAFHMRLPASVVDDHLYSHPPTFLIATIDKFAQMAWNERTGVFLGAGDFPGPSLIIQDELHLISGPLGTVAALYEGAFDIVMSELSTRPKVIASTATIRRADQQVRGLFDRDVFLFPPSGMTSDDSYFVRFDRSRPGRQYVGVMAQSHTPTTANVQAAAALLQAPLELTLTDEERNWFWTLVAYHNSLRELGKTVTLLRDDIPARISVIAPAEDLVRTFDGDDDVVELTSNIPSVQIPRNLERLARAYGEPGCASVVASTNMISVGVDVTRLGLMLMVGQPKSTSEYIQATSRVGRSGPGLVVTLYSAAKPRDRSHYESFKAYHLSLYRQVEPTSVTPYALPARQRALHAALVVLARFLLSYRSNDDAARFHSGPDVDAVIDALTARVAAADSREADPTRSHLVRLVEEWGSRVTQGAATGGLRYRAPRPHVTLLKGFDEHGDAWPTLHSMRSIDYECLIRVRGEDR